MALQSPPNKVYYPISPSTLVGEFNSLNYIIQQSLAKMQTATIVKVVKCTNSGGVSAVGYVDVIPQVNQVNANGDSFPHGTIFNIPYLRIQGGVNAIICDPVAGDLGICVFANRDISNVKTSKVQSAPASFRKFDFGDGMYLGGLLNGIPTNYIQFQGNDVTIKATNINLIGAVNITGAVVASGDITGNGTSLHTHVHSGVQTGGSNTGAPV